MRTTLAMTFCAAVLALSACGQSTDGVSDGLASGGETPAADPTTATTPPATDPQSPAPTTPAAEETAESEDVGVFDMKIGDCIGTAGQGNGEEVAKISTVPCDQPHAEEVFAIIEVPEGDRSFPGPEGFQAHAEAECIGTAFPAYVGLAYDASELVVTWFEPTKEAWAFGDRKVTCTLQDPAGPTTGSLRGANR